MSGRTWVCADHHFGHKNIMSFGYRKFDSIEEHDATLVKLHNELVHPQDRVYFLGDVCINRRSIPTIGLMNGRKVLVRGNHDIFKMSDYEPYFDDIRGCVVGGGKDSPRYILSHIPIHPESLERFDYNIHGHLHQNKLADPKYICVSLEHTDLKPVEIYKAFELR